MQRQQTFALKELKSNASCGGEFKIPSAMQQTDMVLHYKALNALAKTLQVSCLQFRSCGVLQLCAACLLGVVADFAASVSTCQVLVRVYMYNHAKKSLYTPSRPSAYREELDLGDRKYLNDQSRWVVVMHFGNHFELVYRSDQLEYRCVALRFDFAMWPVYFTFKFMALLFLVLPGHLLNEVWMVVQICLQDWTGRILPMTSRVVGQRQNAALRLSLRWPVIPKRNSWMLTA